MTRPRKYRVMDFANDHDLSTIALTNLLKNLGFSEVRNGASAMPELLDYFKASVIATCPKLGDDGGVLVRGNPLRPTRQRKQPVRKARQ